MRVVYGSSGKGQGVLEIEGKYLGHNARKVLSGVLSLNQEKVGAQ